MIKEFKRQSGFTIIETILYIGLFVFIMAAVILTTYSMIASTDKSKYRSLIHNEAQFTIRKFNTVLDGATSVVVSGTVPNQQLRVQYTGSPDKVIDLSDKAIRIDSMPLSGGINPTDPSIAPVSSLSFTASPVAGTRPVEVQMSFRMNNIYYDETFTAKKFVR